MWVLAYLNQTKSYHLKFDGSLNEGIITYSDSDWAGNKESQKSITGNFVTCAQGPVSWVSRKQKTVALSSMEAEYMALSDCSHQLIWIKQLLKESQFNSDIPILHGDNQGSFFWSENAVMEKHSKHIDI